MNARLHQRSFLPGEPFHLRVTPTECGVPMTGRIKIKADIRRPDGTSTLIDLQQSDPGVFEAEVPTSIPGVYQISLSSAGQNYSGNPFSREKLMTAAVWKGGDAPLPTSATEPWCQKWIFELLVSIVVLLFLILLALLF